VSRYQKGKTNLDFTGARNSEWQWHQLDHMQVCTSLQTDNHASTPPLCFLQAGCPSCRPTNNSLKKCQHQLYKIPLLTVHNCHNKEKRCCSKMPYMINSRSVADGICLPVIKSKLVYSSLIFVDNKLTLICPLT